MAFVRRTARSRRFAMPSPGWSRSGHAQERAALLADVVDREVDAPLIAGGPHAALPPARDALAVSRDLADEALVEAGAVGAVPILAGGPPDLPGGAFERHHEQPLDPSRIEVMHRLRLARGRAADDRDAVWHLRGLAHRADDDELAEVLDLRLHGNLHRAFHRDLSFAVPFADQRLELLHRRSPWIALNHKTCPGARTHRPR